MLSWNVLKFILQHTGVDFDSRWHVEDGLFGIWLNTLVLLGIVIVKSTILCFTL
jgi:hypothetical protein